MAKAAQKLRTRPGKSSTKPKSPARRSAARARPKATALPASRPHEFLVKRFDPKDFKSDGLRSYAQYRDLGVKDATHGMAVAHVIRLVGKCEPKVVSKLHTHAAEFQLIYVLKGWMTGEYEGHGAYKFMPGDCWLQPKNIKHKVLDYSEDCELLEIVMPADFDTDELE